MGIILGISAFFHDSSACLVVDGNVVAGALEERFSRKKHDSSIPVQAVAFCLKKAGIEIHEVDKVVFFEKPFTKFERILDNYSKKAPFGFKPFQKAIKVWLKEKLWVEDVIKKKLNFKGEFSYCQHHFSHAVNACYQSGMEEAAYLVVDGVGEKATTSYGSYKNGELNPIAEQVYPHSIGLLYSAFTQYCGFKVNSGEYKLMGLAPYGKPKYTQLIWDEFVAVSDQGVIELKLDKFGFLNDLQMINKKFESAIGKKKRSEGDPMSDFYKDVAASIQEVTEIALIKIMNHVQKKTGSKNLIYGGGVALNCVANSIIESSTEFENVFIHSASGDGGCALGAALWESYRENTEGIANVGNNDFIGPSYSEVEILNALESFKGLSFEKLSREGLNEKVTDLLIGDAVVGWFQGAMEFGPRALGNRSILASPKNPEMKSILNLKIKKREGFRPFAPVILTNEFSDYFEQLGNTDYSRMLYVAKGTSKASGIPSCVHENNTSRVQSLERDFNPELFELMTSFKEKSGIPVLINTSFNERGEPMVCSPLDALNCFFNTEMDAVAIGDYLVLKSENLNVKFNAKVYEMD